MPTVTLYHPDGRMDQRASVDAEGLLREGWSLQPFARQPAVDAVTDPEDDDAFDPEKASRDELKRFLRNQGMTFGPNTGDEKLRELARYALSAMTAKEKQ